MRETGGEGGRGAGRRRGSKRSCCQNADPPVRPDRTAACSFSPPLSLRTDLGDLERDAVLLPELLQLRHDAVRDHRRALGVEAVHHAAHEVDLVKGGVGERGEEVACGFEIPNLRRAPCSSAMQSTHALHPCSPPHLVLDREVDEVGVDEHLVWRPQLRVVFEKERRRDLLDAPHLGLLLLVLLLVLGAAPVAMAAVVVGVAGTRACVVLW